MTTKNRITNRQLDNYDELALSSLNELSDMDRDIVMAYAEAAGGRGWTDKRELSEVYGRDANYYRVRLHRALKKIKTHLQSVIAADGTEQATEIVSFLTSPSTLYSVIHNQIRDSRDDDEPLGNNWVITIEVSEADLDPKVLETIFGKLVSSGQNVTMNVRRQNRSSSEGLGARR